MKKKLLITLASAMAVITLTACSGQTQDSTSISKTANSTEKTTRKKSSVSSKNIEKSKMGNDKNFSLMVEASQSQIPAIKKQTEGLYKDILIEEGKNSTIVYTYIFTKNQDENMDTDALKPILIKGMKSTIDQLKGLFPEVKINVKYLNPNGSEIANFIITQEDTDKID